MGKVKKEIKSVCEECQLKNKCNRIFMVSNTSSPVVVFILPNPIEADLNSKYPFAGNHRRYLILKETVNRIGVSISDVAVLFAIPSVLKMKESSSYKRRKFLWNVMNNCKGNLLKQISKFPEGTLFVTVGEQVTELLLGIKNLTTALGSVKSRIIDDKTYYFVPMIDPMALDKNTRKNNVLFISSVNTLKEALGKAEQQEIKFRILYPSEVEKFTEKILNPKVPIEHIYVDIETTSLDYNSLEVLGIGIATDTKDCVYYIPCKHDNRAEFFTRSIKINEKDRYVIKQCIKKIFAKYPVIGHNIKFDLVALLLNDYVDYEQFTVKADTHILTHIHYNSLYGKLGLKQLSKIFFNAPDWESVIEQEKVKVAKLYKMKKDEVTYDYIPTEILGKYCCYDVFYTRKLYNLLMGEMNEQERTHADRLASVVKAVVLWEFSGMKVDNEELLKLQVLTREKIESIKKEFNNLPTVKKYFGFANLNSTKQLSEIAEKIGIKNAEKTKTGSISLSQKSLLLYLQKEQSEEVKKFCQLLLDYRMYAKLYQTYIKPMPEMVDEFGIFRTSFNVCGTVTGRLSSFFHTIPSKTEYNKNFKRIFVSRFGKNGVIISADFAQLEPRILASLSNDEKLLSVFKEKKDIYKYFASVVYGIPYEEVNKELRNRMKPIVLALTYGMSTETFAERAGITVDEAKRILDVFFSEFESVKRFIENRHAEVMRNASIKTPFGRVIPIDLIDKQEAKRNAQNYIIQSTASELALIQFAKITHSLRKRNCVSQVVGSVHDSIIVDTYIPEMITVFDTIKKYCEEEIQSSFPFVKARLEVELNIGVSWGNSLTVLEYSKNHLKLKGYKEDVLNLANKIQATVQLITEERVELPEDSFVKLNLVGEYILHLTGEEKGIN